MLFERRLRDGIADGSITAALRRWRRPQVVTGRTYRTGAGLVEVTAADPVHPEELTADDARAAGFESVAELLAHLGGPADGHLYLLHFRRVAAPTRARRWPPTTAWTTAGWPRSTCAWAAWTTRAPEAHGPPPSCARSPTIPACARPTWRRRWAATSPRSRPTYAS
ncbi:hypothetical protein ACFQ1L_15305 [Phytohabitans flavus]|uniref:hypothetical protein n=1 Tax=Phytohabitans flavus TaxID=1076124 RepID=UPI003636660D